MKLDRSELSKAVQTALSLGAIAALGAAGPALAQTTSTTGSNNQKPQTLQTVVVTGSHIRRVDLETDNPVVAVTAQQIQATGKLTLGDVVQDLPVITGGVTNPQVNNGGGAGSTVVGLRGLGASRTLVLVDGQRVIGAQQNGGVDLNSIPAAAIERIEVLTSGASAIYGSDAIGGVINVILKSNYQGAQFQLNYGISDHNDGERKGGSFMFGQTSDKGSILAGVSYNKFDSILQSRRDFSKDALSTSGTANGKPVFGVGGSSFALRDHISVDPATAAAFGCASGQLLSLNQSSFDAGTSPTGPGDYHCYGRSDAYNFAAVNYIETPQERTNAFFKGVYHLADNVDFYATYYHNKTTSGFQLAPAVFGTDTTPGVLVNKDSYYNPFGVTFSQTAGAGLRLRMLPVGNRSAKYGSTTDQIITGFRGNFNVLDQNWQWDVGMNYGHISRTQAVLGLPNTAAILPGISNASALDPATGQVVCLNQAGAGFGPDNVISDCTPWDPFNLNSAVTKEALAAAAAPAIIDTWSIERYYHADVNGGLFELPGGTAQLAAGVSYRKEYMNNTVGTAIELNPATLTCTLASQCSAHLQGGYNVKEAYAELYLPLVRDLPFAQQVNLTLAERFSKYSNIGSSHIGSTSNWKIGLEWRPINDLLLRGTVARVFRAPSIGDVFGAPVSSAPFLSSDPCDFAGSGPNPNAGNPACVGVPATGPFKNQDTPNVQQLQGINEGSQSAGISLTPEQGKSFDLGVVYSPSWAPGLSASVDFWRIYLNKTIGLVGVQAVMNQCFAGVTQWCQYINRIQSGPNAGQIGTMIQPTANLGRSDVKGVDLQSAYRLPQFAFGQFTIGLNATYMQQLKIQSAPGTTANQVFEGAGVMGWFGSGLQSVCAFSAGGMCFFPRVRAQASLDWQLGPWSAGWTMRGTSPFKMDGSQGQKAVEGFNRFGTYIYNDLHVGYNIAPLNTMVQLGVDNVFDKQPPLLGGNRTLNANTDPADFDTIGRYYWARMTVNF